MTTPAQKAPALVSYPYAPLLASAEESAREADEIIGALESGRIRPKDCARILAALGEGE